LTVWSHKIKSEKQRKRESERRREVIGGGREGFDRKRARERKREPWKKTLRVRQRERTRMEGEKGDGRRRARESQVRDLHCIQTHNNHLVVLQRI